MYFDFFFSSIPLCCLIKFHCAVLRHIFHLVSICWIKWNRDALQSIHIAHIQMMREQNKPFYQRKSFPSLIIMFFYWTNQNIYDNISFWFSIFPLVVLFNERKKKKMDSSYSGNIEQFYVNIGQVYRYSWLQRFSFFSYFYSFNHSSRWGKLSIRFSKIVAQL